MIFDEAVLMDEQIKGPAEIICTAMRTHRLLELINGANRSLVQVHAVGVSNEDKAAMYVCEVQRDGDLTYNWKVIHLDELMFLTITKEEFDAARFGYNRPDASIMKFDEEACPTPHQI